MVSRIRYTQDPKVSSEGGDCVVQWDLSLESQREIGDSHFQLQDSIFQWLTQGFSQECKTLVP